jgi:hypothetical protein
MVIFEFLAVVSYFGLFYVICGYCPLFHFRLFEAIISHFLIFISFKIIFGYVGLLLVTFGY